MGFASCSESEIAKNQKESEDLKANFEQTIKKLNLQKIQHEEDISKYNQ
jgi:hypothetical protein